MANAFLEGIGMVLGKASTFVPGRVEQMKNEKERLINERSKILDKDKKMDADRDRLVAIDKRVSQINSILGNKASD